MTTRWSELPEQTYREVYKTNNKRSEHDAFSDFDLFTLWASGTIITALLEKPVFTIKMQIPSAGEGMVRQGV